MVDDRPVLLDLFCGPGGAAVGYDRVGFRVIGVDHVEQPRYPFEFHHIDWEAGLWWNVEFVDAIHASPPCQKYARIFNPNGVKRSNIDLIAPVREALQRSGKPFVIENVPSAPLENPILLCGQAFGIRVIKHRLFESNVYIGESRHSDHIDYVPLNGYEDFALPRAMDCSYMLPKESRQAVPPAYTEYIGKHLIRSI